MDFNELPKAVQTYWNSLSVADQQVVLSCLAANRRPMKFVLKIPATVERTGNVLAYCHKHNIKFEAKRIGEKIHFIFDKHGIRNEVFIGMHTL